MNELIFGIIVIGSWIISMIGGAGLVWAIFSTKIKVDEINEKLDKLKKR